MGKWFDNTGVAGSLWGDSLSSGANLREEFNQLVLGRGSYPGIGQFLLHRILDRTGSRCPCWDDLRGSSSNCKYCQGESFKWTESWIRGYFTQTFGRSLSAATQSFELRQTGQYDLDKAIIYLPWDTTPVTGDALFRIRVNTEGKPYYPIERVEKWRAVNVEDRRQERGELAFWLVLCERIEV